MNTISAQEYYRKLFFMCVVIGTIIILFVNQMKFHLHYQLIVLLVMVGYVTVYNTSESKNDFRSQFADSVYYLGFIFTLVSLGVSLLLLNSDGKLEPIVVLSSFGVALSTTIFGLIVRAFYTQFNGGGEEDLRDANHTLVQTARDFSLKLSRFSQDIDTSHNLIEKNNKLFLDGQKKHLNELYKNVIEDVKNGISGSIGEISLSVNSSFVSLSENVKSLSKVSKAGVTALNKNINLLDESLSKHGAVFDGFNDLIETENDNLLTNYQALNESSKEIQKKLSEVMEVATEKVSDNFDSVISDEIKSFENLVNVLGTVNESMINSAQSIDSFSKSSSNIQEYSVQMKDAVEAIKNLNIDTSVVSDNFSEFQKTIESVNLKILDNVKDVQGKNDVLQVELQKSVKLTNDMHAAIVDSASEMISKLNNE